MIACTAHTKSHGYLNGLSDCSECVMAERDAQGCQGYMFREMATRIHAGLCVNNDHPELCARLAVRHAEALDRAIRGKLDAPPKKLAEILADAGVPLTDDEAAALERGEEVKLRLPASGDWGKAYQGKGTV